MAKTVIDKVEDYINGLATTIDKGTAAVIIRAVDNGAEEFKKTVKAYTPFATGALKNSIRLTRTFKKGMYGYRVGFEGYNRFSVPFQLIANTLNTGRAAGVSTTGYAISNMEGIKFITNSLQVLRQIDPEIAGNMKIGGWTITDTDLILNDGTRISLADLNNYDRLRNSPTE